MSKGLEAFDNIKWEILEWTEGYEEDLNIIEKELKAIEIIREYCYFSRKKPIPKAKYKLLAEVLEL